MAQAAISLSWDEQNRDAIERCVALALEKVKQDYSLRGPRTEEERRNGFAVWRQRWQETWQPLMEEVAQQTFGDDHETIRYVVACCVWPEVERYLTGYAVLRQASAWKSHHMGDAVTMRWPEPTASGWRVQLGVNRYGDDFGQIVLDTEGNVLEDLTTTRDELLARINDR